MIHSKDPVRLLPALLVLGLATVAVHPASAANFQVQVVNNAFQPANINIQAGDSVTWINQGIAHNVAAADGSFRCANGCDATGGNGNPASNPWSFTLTFNEPGAVPYYCQVHGTASGLGMAGVINVEDTVVTNPGTLTLSSSNFPVSEGVGSVTVTVQRIGGSDGAVSVQYFTTNNSATAPADYQTTQGTLDWADGDAGNKTFLVPIVDDSNAESREFFTVRLSDPTGGAVLGRASSRVTINDNDQPDNPNQGNPGSLQFSQAVYEVNEADGTATVMVQRTGGSGGQVSAQVTATGGTATEDSDFTPESETVTFAAGDAAAKQVVIPILEDTEDEGAETIHLQLSAPTGGVTFGAQIQSQVAILDDEGLTSCSESDELALCLGEDGRFKVQVSFRNRVPPPTGGTTTNRGKKLPVNRDSGLFTFFDANNAELLVKILAGCPITNHYWVFLAGTTNVEYTLTVTDTLRGVPFYTSNPLDHTATTVLDTMALDTCP